MLAKRIIPCLDVTGGRVVKGVNFVELRDAGDPVEIAKRYDDQGADEITFLDITASSDDRDIILHIVEACAEQVFIPLTVGGGVRKVEDVRRLLNAGADKVSRRRTSSTWRTPPPTVSGMKTCEATASTMCRMMSRSSELAVISRKVISSAPWSS